MHSVTGGPRANATAYINYYLADVPDGPVDIEILDDEGRTVNSLRGTRSRGINRVGWNLRHEGAREAKLRTKPPGNPHVVEEKRFRTTWEREGWYPIESWGTSAGFQGVVIAPGTYTVRLTVGDEVQTQDLLIRKDPRSDGTVADIQQQVALALELRDDLNTTSDMISEIELIKRRLQDLREAMEREEDATTILAESEALYTKLQALEDKLLQPVLAEGDSKSFRYPNRLYSQLSFLIGNLGSSVDFAPNAQQTEVQQVLKARLLQYQAEFQALLDDDVATFNRLVRGRLIS